MIPGAHASTPDSVFFEPGCGAISSTIRVRKTVAKRRLKRVLNASQPH